MAFLFEMRTHKSFITQSQIWDDLDSDPHLEIGKKIVPCELEKNRMHENIGKVILRSGNGINRYLEPRETNEL